MKKLIFVISFIVLSGFLFGFTAPDAKAATVAELQALIQQLQAQILTLQQQLAQLQPMPVTWCHTFNTNLGVGNTGSEVTALQTALQKEGLYQRTISGNFDEYTASVVVGFQEKYASEVLAPWGLTHGTGYVGPTTRAKLNKLYGCGMVKAYIKVISPNGGEEWLEGKNHVIYWEQRGLEKWGNRAKICLIGFDSFGQPIAVKGDRKNSACAYAESSQGLASYLITETSLTNGKYNWEISNDILKTFEKVPVNYKVSILVFDELPQVQRTGWAGLIDQAESNDYFSIINELKEELCGDVNASGKIDIGDVVLLRNHIAYPEQYPISSKWSTDVNCDGAINILDATLLQNYVGYPEKYQLNCCGIAETYIQVISPNGGEIWTIGNTYSITWGSVGVDKVNISYYRKGGPISLCDGCCDYNLMAENVSASLGKYSWTVPSNFSAGEYKILIRDSSLSPAVPPCANDFSDNYFSIVISKEGPCGDFTGDGYVYLNDVTLLQNYVSYPYKYPISNKWVADVNCDGAIDMGDVILLQNYINYPGSYVLRCCGGTCGDVNRDGEINIGDSTLCYNHVKSPIVYPLPNPWAADVNCDKKIDNNDCNLILNYVGYPGQYKFNCCP